MSGQLSPFIVVILSIAILSIAGLILQNVVVVEESTSEGFGATQPGTLVQLASSHVPTAEDASELAREERQIRKEIIDMTGYW